MTKVLDILTLTRALATFHDTATDVTQLINPVQHKKLR